jgi:hypothetical protein
MNTELRAGLAESGRRQRAERRPVDMAEIMAAVDAASVSLDASTDSAVHSVEAEAAGSRGDALMFDSHWHVEESTAPPERKRWIGALIAVAATILVAVGVLAVAVAERDVEDVDPVLSPSLTDPPVSSEPSVVPGNAAVPGDQVRQELNGVIATDTGLTAVGSLSTGRFTNFSKDAAVWTSVDGTEWSQVPHDAAVFAHIRGGQTIRSVGAGGPGRVAVGDMAQTEDYADPGHAAAVWTSVDGITWSLVPHDEVIFGGPGNQGMNDVTAGGPGLVAIGNDGGGNNVSVNAAVWTSVDGTTWSRISHDETIFGGARMHSVTVGGPGLVAVGSTGIGGDNLDFREATEADKNFATNAAVWTSVDGITWSRVPHDDAVFGGPGHQTMSKVIAAGPGLVAVGSDGTDDDADAAVWTSVDGITWSRVPHDETIFGGPNAQQMSSVTVGGPGLVAVGSDGPHDYHRGGDEDIDYVEAAVWTSFDGVTWLRVPHDEDIFGGDSNQWMTGVTIRGSRLVAVGKHGNGAFRYDGTVELAVWTSSDGITWTRTAPPPEESNADSSLTTIRPSTTID